MSASASKVAALWLEARDVTAKPRYLKAVDYTIGLVKRLDSSGLLSFPTGTLRRLVDLREAASIGVDLSAVSRNVGLLSTYGAKILNQVESMEKRVAPLDEDFAAFSKPFPKTVDNALLVQSRFLEGLISREMGVPRASVSSSVLGSKEFFNEAFSICSVEVSRVYRSIVSKVSSLGNTKSRMKDPKSCWGKQHREATPLPFYEFKDLIGTRVVADSLVQLCSIAKSVQNNFGVLDKKNYYLLGKGYNAINYNMQEGWAVFEFQLKTEMNNVEAKLSHDLIYAPEKAVLNLSPEEKELVAMVITLSTQLSMRDWHRNFGVPVKLARQAP
jgi:ppGpp synthetase/RelA/SpoT-type nucleotidyltranferase